ncbi:hypothetical protein Tco_0642790, partial [Tanacetum coccineum]
MADLKFVDQHNMVACLEKSDENAEFHQIVYFLSTCSINYALTVSPTIYVSYIEQFWNTATSKIINSVKQIHAIVDGKDVVILESLVRSDLLFNDEDAHLEQIPPSLTTYQRKRKTKKHRRTKKDTELPQTSVPQDHEADKAVLKERDDSVERAITTVASLDAAQDSGSPKRQETLGGTLAHTRSERVLEQPYEPPLSEGHTSGSGEGSMEQTFELTDNVPSTPHDLPLIGGYTPGSDEGRMKLDELITLCTKLSKQVLDLEKEKDAQAMEILNLKKRVKKFERKRKSSTSHLRRRKYRQVETSSDDGLDEEDASKQGRRSDKLKPMFKDKDFEELDDYMENVVEETVDAAATGVSTVSAPVSFAGVTISTAEPKTPPTTTTVFDDEDVTMAMVQTLIKMKEQKAKEKRVAITDVEDSSNTIRPVRSITTLQPLPTIDPKDKGKGVLVEEEPKKIKRRDQGLAQIESDAELAQRIHEEELAELERAQQERQRQEDDTNAALAKEFDEIQARIDADHELAVRLTHEEQEKYTIKERARLLAKLFDQRKKQLAAARAEIDDFQPMDTEAIKDSEKKVDSSSNLAEGKEQESAKSDKEAATDHEHEKEELRMWLTVVSDEEETVDLMILSAKYPIVDWEYQNLGSVDMEDLHVYKTIRAYRNTSYHKSLSNM